MGQGVQTGRRRDRRGQPEHQVGIQGHGYG